MQALIWLHRWLGAVLGIVLVVLALSGTVLIWEDSWIAVPGAGDAPVRDPAALAMAVDVAKGHGADLSRITFAGGDFGLHHAAYRDGSGIYIDGAGRIVDRWDSAWGRPELWIFDLHHYLLLGDTGAIVAGVAGLAGLFFVVSGAIIWWRTRKTFAFRLLPKRLSRSAIVRQHRDLGIVAAPFLALLFLTGAAMIFDPVEAALTAPFPDRVPNPPEASAPALAPDDVAGLLAQAQRLYPNAAIRRLQFGEDGLTLRLKQNFEWTPNGRTYLRANGGPLSIDAPDRVMDKPAFSEKFYPLHSGKVGGILWKITLTLAGLSLAVLGIFTLLSFWRKRSS
jgi:uncharacterized iron-regulated membrane protein